MTKKRFFRTEQDSNGEFQVYRETEKGIEVSLLIYRGGPVPHCLSNLVFRPGDDDYESAKKVLNNS